MRRAQAWGLPTDGRRPARLRRQPGIAGHQPRRGATGSIAGFPSRSVIWGTGRATYAQFKHSRAPRVRVRDYLVPDRRRLRRGRPRARARRRDDDGRAVRVGHSRRARSAADGRGRPPDDQRRDARAGRRGGSSSAGAAHGRSARRDVRSILERPRSSTGWRAGAAARARPDAAADIARRIHRVARLAFESAEPGSRYSPLTHDMPLLDPRPTRVRFTLSGIAGAGMSALAELFIRRGVHVTGATRTPRAPPTSCALGVRVGPHDPAHVDGARALVVTSAMPKDHPELVRARELGIPVIRRAEALGEVTAGRELVGDRRHARQDDDDRHDDDRARRGRARSHGARRRARERVGREPARGQRPPVRRRGGRVRPLVPRAVADGRRRHEHRGRSPRHLRRLADIERAFAQFVRGARYDRAVRGGRSRERILPPRARRSHSLRDHVARRAPRRATDRIARGRGSSFDVVYDDELLGSRPAAAFPDSTTSQRARRASERARARRRFRRRWPRARVVRRRGAALPAPGRSAAACWSSTTTRTTRPRSRATLAAARGAFPEPPPRRRVSAAPLHANARLRARVRRVAGRARTRSFSPRSIRRASSRSQGVTSALVADALMRPADALAWRGTRAHSRPRSRPQVLPRRRRAHRRRRRHHQDGPGAARASSRADARARRGPTPRSPSSGTTIARGAVAAGSAGIASAVLGRRSGGRSCLRRMAFFRVRRVEILRSALCCAE